MICALTRMSPSQQLTKRVSDFGSSIESVLPSQGVRNVTLATIVFLRKFLASPFLDSIARSSVLSIVFRWRRAWQQADSQRWRKCQMVPSRRLTYLNPFRTPLLERQALISLATRFEAVMEPASSIKRCQHRTPITNTVASGCHLGARPGPFIRTETTI